MAGLNNVGGINKVLRNGALGDEPSLIRMNQFGDKGAEAEGETFSEKLEAEVLKGDGAKVIRFSGSIFFREETNKSLVDRAEVGF